MGSSPNFSNHQDWDRATIDRWFDRNNSNLTYASYLSKFLSEPELAIVQQAIVDRPRFCKMFA